MVTQDAAVDSTQANPYWLYPFKSYQTCSPYLVGSYIEVAEVLSGYHSLGVSAMILETPLEQAGLRHTAIALDLAGVGRSAAVSGDQKV